MSIEGVVQSSLAALQANQLALRTVSSNVANLNTEGYARQETHFQANGLGNGATGVTAQINRAVDQFLQSAHLTSSAVQAGADIQASWLDRAQALLGDPTGDGTMFGALDEAFSALAALPADPASSLRKTDVIDSVSRLLERVETVAKGVTQLRQNVRTQIDSSVAEVNSLLQSIATLNSAILASGAGQNSTSSAASAEQAALIDRLSQLIDIRVQDRLQGGVQIRTQSGLILADAQAGHLGYDTSKSEIGELRAYMPQSDVSNRFSGNLREGELAGLIALDGRELPDVSAALGAFAAGIVDSFNHAHNQAWPVPAPSSLSGHATGLLASDSIGFSGVARLGIVDDDGRLDASILVDFDAGIISNNAGLQVGIGTNIGDFVAALNLALGNNASADFAGGRLSLSSDSGGLVVEQDADNPSQRGGLGFAESFGLNNLIESVRPTSFVTGLSANDAHGFTLGQTIEFAIRDTQGQISVTREFTIQGAQISGLVDGLNTALSGHATAELDANGQINLISIGSDPIALDIVNDPSLRGDTGLSFSQIFGLGQSVQTQRAIGLEVRSDIKADPRRLGHAMAQLDGTNIGTLVLMAGDSSGALLLEAASTTSRSFPNAGLLSGRTATLSDYGAALAASIGQQASAAQSRSLAAAATHSDVHDRRQSAQGVNLDEELVKMTSYQRAYAAASRMMQASQELYDTLLRIV